MAEAIQNIIVSHDLTIDDINLLAAIILGRSAGRIVCTNKSTVLGYGQLMAMCDGSTVGQRADDVRMYLLLAGFQRVQSHWDSVPSGELSFESWIRNGDRLAIVEHIHHDYGTVSMFAHGSCREWRETA